MISGNDFIDHSIVAIYLTDVENQLAMHKDKFHVSARPYIILYLTIILRRRGD